MVLPKQPGSQQSRYTPEELAALDRLYDRDIAAFLEDKLFIRPKKGGGVIPLTLNKGQWKLVRAVQEQWDAGRPVRVIVLKARQIGFSTATQGINVWFTTRRKQVNSLIIAHESDASKNLYQMFLRCIDHLEPEFRPMIKSRNEALGVIEFDNPDQKDRSRNPGLSSSVRIETAEDPHAGRSGTFQFIHASEVAFFPHPETFTALLQTMPNEPGTIMILESTANGASGNFYALWKAAERGENDFVPVFIAWWEHDEYRRPVTDEEAAIWARVRLAIDTGEHPERADIEALSLTAEELDLAARFPVDYGQIKWRRWAIVNLSEGDIDRFHQEYPASPDEAFLVSGRPWFDIPTVVRLKEEAREIRPGRFTIDLEESEAQRRPVLREDPFGEVYVFTPPVKGRRYVLGADVSQGEEGGDYDAAVVLDVSTMEDVAYLHGLMDTDMYARRLHWLGMHYNRAMLAPEANNMGAAVVNVLERYTHYPNLWGDGWPHRTRIRQYGWQTNMRTRPVILGRLRQAIREGVLRPRLLAALDEMLTFKVNAKGKPEADSGQHDDLIFALAIALELREHEAARSSHRLKNVVNLGGTLPGRPKLRVVPKHPRW